MAYKQNRLRSVWELISNIWPFFSPASTTAAGDPQQSLIKKYNRSKLFAFLSLVAFTPFGISLAVLEFQSQSQPQSALKSGAIGRQPAATGKLVTVPFNHNGQQEILISEDSGYTYFRTGDLWPLKDTDLFLAIAPDTQTIFALEPSGILHYKPANQNHFLSFRMTLDPPDSTFTGMIFSPKKDSIYAFGHSSKVITFKWKDPIYPIVHLTKDYMDISAMAVSPAGKIAVLDQYPRSKTTAIYFGNSFADLQQIKSYFADNQIGYDPVKDSFYSTFSALTLRYESTWNNLSAAMLITFANATVKSSKYQASRVLIDNTGTPIFYGVGPIIQQGDRFDSIPLEGDIRWIGLQNNLPALAMVYSNDTNCFFTKGKNGWSINPILISPENTGSKRVWAAAISIFFLVISGLLLLLCQNLQKHITIAQTENALVTKSEKPQGLQDTDLLGFQPIENAILNIIRNPQTDLPMTIVISGSWGSGKSSMMNRIRQTLEKRPFKSRFMTTWFNAWHFQGESNLLDAFLLSVVKGYEGHFEMFSAFRIQIAAQRFVKLPFWKKFGFGFVIAFLFPLLLYVVFTLLPFDFLKGGWVKSYGNILSSIFHNKDGWNWKAINIVGTVIVGALSIIFIKREYAPAGLNTFFELIRHNEFQLYVEDDQPGSRERFKQQYWELIAAAPKDNRLVVFIDDLDRITGEKILELLEGINFISDIASRPPSVGSVVPNTFFILGMDSQEVARLVGTQLKKINDSDLPAQDLGNLYIEKMVQLIVPVPFDTDQENNLKKLYEN